MTYVIADPCIEVKDGACIDVCPVKAIFPDVEAPAKWHGSIKANADFFVRIRGHTAADQRPHS